MARIWMHSLHAHSTVACVVPLASKALANRNVCNVFTLCVQSQKSSSYALRSGAASESLRPLLPLSRCVPAVVDGHSIRPLKSVLSGLRKAHISTVVSHATSGSVEVGGSTSKPTDREVLVQHLLVKEDQLQLLLEIERKVTQEGLDLSDLAAEHSICPSNVEGGMLGWLSMGQTDPSFEEVAFGAPLNQLVRVKTKHGWHLLQVLSERQAMKLEQIQDEEFHERMQDPSFLEEAQLIDAREGFRRLDNIVGGIDAYSKKVVTRTAATFAPRASTASKNPATPGSTLYKIFEGQAYLSMVVGGALSCNLLFPSDQPDIWRLMGMWSIWMFTVPSLRARDCPKNEKEVLNYLFILLPLINVTLPLVWKSFGAVWAADVLAFFSLYAWKMNWLSDVNKEGADD